MLLAASSLQIQLASAQTAEVQQLILNIEKLAQLKQILSNMKTGYQAVTQGYGKIKGLVEGNYKVHEVFLDELLAVNPELRRYRKVAAIIGYQGKILSEYKAAFGRFKNGGRFTPQEIGYLGKVYGNLFDRSLENLDELTMVLTAGKLRMSDEERITAIDRLYEDMEGKLAFLRGFNKRTSAVDAQRKAAGKDLHTLKLLQGE